MNGFLQFAVLLILVGVVIAGIYYVRRRGWFARRPFPVEVVPHYGDRSEDNIPLQMWLNFSNPSALPHTLTISIEFDAGKNLVQQIAVPSGEFSYRIPEPQRVKRVRVSADGYAGIVVMI